MALSMAAIMQMGFNALVEIKEIAPRSRTETSTASSNTVIAVATLVKLFSARWERAKAMSGRWNNIPLARAHATMKRPTVTSCLRPRYDANLFRNAGMRLSATQRLDLHRPLGLVADDLLDAQGNESPGRGAPETSDPR